MFDVCFGLFQFTRFSGIRPLEVCDDIPSCQLTSMLHNGHYFEYNR